ERPTQLSLVDEVQALRRLVDGRVLARDRVGRKELREQSGQIEDDQDDAAEDTDARALEAPPGELEGGAALAHAGGARLGVGVGAVFAGSVACGTTFAAVSHSGCVGPPTPGRGRPAGCRR